jgi:SAM-dependent methyltransferase
MPDVHRSAAQGFAAAAEAYERGRPSYPPALLPWLTGALGLQAGATCVDLGAGTGKFTRLLLASGAEVIAVEPVAEMRDQLAAGLPGVRALEGTAQALPLADASVHAVVCAQAFHWFASAPALAEIHRVLEPGGRLGLVWNVRDESVDWIAAMTAILAPHEGDTPRFHTGRWRQAFTGGLFTELEEACFPYEHVGPPREVIVDRTLSVSFIANLPAAERKQVEDQLLALIASHPGLRDRETVAVPYLTRAYWCTKQVPSYCRVPDPRIEPSAGHQVHIPVQQCFQVLLQTHVSGEGRLSQECHQEVDITIRPCLPSGETAKEVQMHNPIAHHKHRQRPSDHFYQLLPVHRSHPSSIG